MDRDLLRATAALYDATAHEYARRVGTELSDNFETSFDRAILASTADTLVRRRGLVLDLGCGPGRVTAYLGRRDIDVVGLDVSTGMLASARTAHPQIPFVRASLEDIPVRSASVAGVICWYSIIHTPPDDLRAVFREIRRTCRPGAEALIAFQAGNGERVDRTDAYGSGITLTSYRHSVHGIADALTSAGFDVTARSVRDRGLDHETTPQAFVVAHVP